MGGFGSGRDAYATTPTVEQCYHLDVTDLTEGVDHPGAKATSWWGDREDPSVSVTIQFKGDEDADRVSHIRLQYTVTDTQTGEKTEHDYPVPLEYTECNFGGVRPWFRCPGVVDGETCNRRAGKLYLPRGGEYFLCRECYDLGYRSSRTSGMDIKQAELRYRRAFSKADKDNRRPHPNNQPYFPERPKGMHHDTFERLCDEVDKASREWDEAMDERMRELISSSRE